MTAIADSATWPAGAAGLAPPHAVLLGDAARPEFAEVVRQLAEGTRLHHATDVDAALDWPADDEPELFVVLQERPSRFTAADVDRLRRAAPLARVVAVAGSWCEGELRTGRPWPADWRVYWHEFTARFERELARRRRGEVAAWGLPPTATAEERLLSAPRAPSARRAGRVAIHSARADVAAWLAAACSALGYTTSSIDRAGQEPGSGASAAIWDQSTPEDAVFAGLRQFAAQHPAARIVALLSFPRAEDVQRARAAGAHRVLSKPVNLDDLEAALVG